MLAAEPAECQHDLKSVERPVMVDHDAKRPMIKDGKILLEGGEFQYSGAKITMLVCQKKGCKFFRATSMRIEGFNGNS